MRRASSSACSVVLRRLLLGPAHHAGGGVTRRGQQPGGLLAEELGDRLLVEAGGDARLEQLDLLAQRLVLRAEAKQFGAHCPRECLDLERIVTTPDDLELGVGHLAGRRGIQ